MSDRALHLVCLGLSHHTADVATREQFALAEHELGAESSRLGAMAGIREAVIVSTCNRVELYAACEEPERATEALHQFLDERAAAETRSHPAFYRFGTTGSVRHLFRVVCGLESMVLGETEILGQVKKAYGAAAARGSTARHLNKLFQRAFSVAKEVRTKTGITRGPVSVGSVAVDLAERIFGRLAACKVMILGAGETSELTARALLARGAKSIFVSNRSYERAATLAAEMGGEAVRFDEWHRSYDEVDILISSTAAPHPIVTREKLRPVMRFRCDRPLFIIDLAVPRDVEPAVNNLDGVYLYDIDSLRALAEQSLEIRRQELAVCERMIERHVLEFTGWLNGSPGSSVVRTETPVALAPRPSEATS